MSYTERTTENDYWTRRVENGEYVVNVWGCRPGEDDACWFGLDFGNEADAREAFRNPDEAFGKDVETDAHNVFIHLYGPDVDEERRLNPDRETPDDDTWQREFATQAGMAFGCQGYNDAMGY